MTLPLPELQSWLLGAVMEAEAPGATNERARALVLEQGLSPERRLAIYRRGYFARLVECLLDDYPTVSEALGAEAFEALCTAFIRAHPPQSSSLNFYGAPFAAYCARRPEPWHAVIAELARLEWALVEAIHQSAEPVLASEALAAIAPQDWEHLRLQPSAALSVLAFEYPVNAYLQAVREGETPELPEERAPNRVAVCRHAEDVWRFSLEPNFADLLSDLCAGQTLPAALERFEQNLAVDSHEAARNEATQAVLAAFRDWVACGFFAGIHPG